MRSNYDEGIQKMPWDNETEHKEERDVKRVHHTMQVLQTANKRKAAWCVMSTFIRGVAEVPACGSRLEVLL